MTSTLMMPGSARPRVLRRITVFAAVGAAIALFTANALLTIVALAALPLLFAFLWRDNEPPVLLFAAGFQWLQVVMPVLNANKNHEQIQNWSFLEAAWLGLASVVVLAAGMRIGRGSKTMISTASLNEGAAELSVKRLRWAYFLSFAVGRLSELFTAFVPGLRQQLLALVALRWAAIFLIGWAALRDRRFRPLAWMVMGIEVILGFAGYFGAFKSILFLFIILVVGSGRRLRKANLVVVVLVVSAVVVLAAFWQSVKFDYRLFLSEGEHAQVIRVPFLDRLAFLADKAAHTSWADLLYGWDSALERLGYLEFFSYTIQTVPNRVPYQQGRLWLEAVTHVVTPRILFPNKLAIDDSQRTREFTSMWVAGADEGVSISIGYAAESYIDFGPVGMFVPILLLGCFWGWAYAWIASRTQHSLLGLAVAANIILSNAIYFESSNIKLMGGGVTSTVVLWLTLKYAGDRIWRFVAPGSSRRPPIAVADRARTRLEVPQAI